MPSLQVKKVYFWGGSGREPLQFFFIQTGVWDYANYCLEPYKLQFLTNKTNFHRLDKIFSSL